MASLNDIYDAFQNKTFENVRRKIEIALLIKAQSLLAGAATGERRAWALRMLSNNESESLQLLKYNIGLNSAQSIINLSNDSDTVVKNYVDATIDVLYPA